MSGYSLEDEHGIPYYTYHADRTVCDVEGCTCVLPTSAQVYAQRTADARAEWLVAYRVTFGVDFGITHKGPMPKDDARAEVDRLLGIGLKPKLLRVVEDYT